ncbi:MAG: L,D-transpeptidase [Bacillota bacterium]
MAFYDDYRLVRVFAVATGKAESFTPEGIYPIVNKIKNRPYYKKNIPGGDPRNPLGNRWLGLKVNDTYGTTYAIHGNNNPDSIGKYASLGCIRMHNEDVEWLYERVEVGTNVIIVNSNDSLNTIAANYGYDVDTYFYQHYNW